jgi:lipopolysaccharide biosynthesis protein
VEPFTTQKRVGAVGPKVVYPNGRLQEAGTLLNPDATSELIGLADHPALPRFNYLREVDYCSGACLIVETAKFRELGGFDDALAPAYCEDVDLCLRLRAAGLRIVYQPKAVIIHHLSKTSESLDNSYKMKCVVANQQKLSQRWQKDLDALSTVRLLAFYLPQFHPIPENDLWWGKGFTEWTNVAKARPNFAGHYQPRLPSDLGFYDLRVPEVMDHQAALAQRYGIYGFCYYYYWFNGRRLLELPLERMLQSGRPNSPFCLCWANENWTRRWDGMEQEILMGQQHSDADDVAVIQDLMRYMRVRNYIRINGKPLLLVYRANKFPDIRRTAMIWRDLCQKKGLGEIYLAMVECFEDSIQGKTPADFGFDASVEFPPHGIGAEMAPPGRILNPNFVGHVRDYREAVIKYMQRPVPGFTRFRSVMPSWDNTARRQERSDSFVFSSPGAFQAWLEAAIHQTREQNFGDERLVFVNAWNEWAEGAYLEPDRRFGHAYLEAVRNALQKPLL